MERTRIYKTEPQRHYDYSKFISRLIFLSRFNRKKVDEITDEFNIDKVILTILRINNYVKLEDGIYHATDKLDIRPTTVSKIIELSRQYHREATLRHKQKKNLSTPSNISKINNENSIYTIIELLVSEVSGIRQKIDDMHKRLF
jgi:hypothetical protein